MAYFFNKKISESKDKFFKGNKDIFLKYFDSSDQYDALILAGNFRKLEQIIALNTNFCLKKFQQDLGDCAQGYQSFQD